MYLAHYATPQGTRWTRDGHFLPQGLSLSFLLGLSRQALLDILRALPTEEAVEGNLLAPIEPLQEVWASGVTYLRSRDARKAESETADIYEKVYQGQRPELFFKASGWRVVGHEQTVRIRRDSQWDVPEPELVLVLNRHLEIVGYCAGNDMSSRNIEGENPLYLPQAKMYDGSCALGPGIQVVEREELRDMPIRLSIIREGSPIFQEEIRTSQMKRSLEELVAYLGREMSFPAGAFLMTGTGIIPPETFTLRSGDLIEIKVGTLVLCNDVSSSPLQTVSSSL